jgi:hypothetical protein
MNSTLDISNGWNRVYGKWIGVERKEPSVEKPPMCGGRDYNLFKLRKKLEIVKLSISVYAFLNTVAPL